MSKVPVHKLRRHKPGNIYHYIFFFLYNAYPRAPARVVTAGMLSRGDRTAALQVAKVPTCCKSPT